MQELLTKQMEHNAKQQDKIPIDTLQSGKNKDPQVFIIL